MTLIDFQQVAKSKGLLAVLFAVVLLLPFVASRSMIFLGSVIFVFAMLGYAAVMPIGYLGQLILSQGAFFGIGAYGFILVTNAGVPSWIAIVIACIAAGAIALLLGIPAIRSSGIYLGIITLAFNEIFVISLDLFPDIFGGSQGLSSPELWTPELLTRFMPSEVVYYYLAFILFVIVYLIFTRVLSSNIGWALLVTKEDIDAAESIGIDTRRYRLFSFTASGLVCGLAGGIYAPLTGYISPTVFNLGTTVDVILVGVIGGILAPRATILGAIIVVLLPELLGPLSKYRMMVFGLALVLLLMYLPEGIGGMIKERLNLE